MKIYLARHGQSRWQVERDDGDWDSPLTTMGQKQAQLLADWLADHQTVDQESHLDLGTICTSPLQRARQTAEPVAAALSLPLMTMPTLREADFYVSDHLPSRKTPYQAQPLYQTSARYDTFKNQARSALHTLIERAEGDGLPVLGIAHGGLISTMLRLAVGSDSISFWIYNTSLSLIEWKRGRWHLVHLNLWDHLPPAYRTY